MRKILVAVCAVAVAVVANAAAINWSAMAVGSSPDVALTSANQYTGYFFATADSSSQLTTTTIAAVITAITEGDDFASLASYSTQNAFIASTSKGNFQSNGNGSFATGDTVSGFVIIVDDANSPKNYLIAQTTAGDQILTKTATATGNMVFSYGAQTASTWTAVPEPTSGILLLIGLAGMALKRRIA